jgi:hypothetical protein
VFKELVLHLSVIFLPLVILFRDKRNALLPRKVNMMMILQQFDKNIERLNKFK